MFTDKLREERDPETLEYYRSINNIQIVLEDDEGNLLDLTMNYSLSLDVHIIPNKMLLYSNAITNGN